MKPRLSVRLTGLEVCILPTVRGNGRSGIDIEWTHNRSVQLNYPDNRAVFLATESPKKVSAMGGGVNVSVRCSGLGNPKFRDVGCTSTCSFG